MSLAKNTHQQSLFETGALVGHLCERKNLRRYRLLRDHVLPLLEQYRKQLEALYCPDNGRPAVDPVLLAGVTLLQFMERLPDRQAAEAVVVHIGWKVALGLDIGYAGFHPTLLCIFRDRLVEAELGSFIFDVTVEGLRKAGLLRKRGKQRLDSTHILGNVAKMNRLECVREALRLAFQSLPDEALQGDGPAWAVLRERYCETSVDWRDQNKASLQRKMVQAGEDAAALLGWWEQQSGRWGQKAERQFALLQRVFGEQFELVEGALTPCKSTPSGGVVNPHDPEAQWSCKGPDRKMEWTGSKAQVVETVPEDGEKKRKGEPTEQFITAVVITEAITSDIEGMSRVLEAQKERHGIEPSELFTDAGYISDDTLYEAQQAGWELIGPARPSPKHLQGFPTEDFFVDLDDEHNPKAICPAGECNTQCALITENTGKQYYRFEWSYKCDTCLLRELCVTNKTGRRQLAVGLYHHLLQARRNEMKPDQFQKRMHQRAAIEGTNSELKRKYGFGRSRYRGLAKTSLACSCAAAACDVNRWLRLVLWRADQGGPAMATA
jgi:hypothetical protein